jgi:hypothetical protein
MAADTFVSADDDILFIAVPKGCEKYLIQYRDNAASRVHARLILRSWAEDPELSFDMDDYYKAALLMHAPSAFKVYCADAAPPAPMRRCQRAKRSVRRLKYVVGAALAVIAWLILRAG